MVRHKGVHNLNTTHSFSICEERQQIKFKLEGYYVEDTMNSYPVTLWFCSLPTTLFSSTTDANSSTLFAWSIIIVIA
jgi:hypothetical protein